MTEEQARSHAEALAIGMGITFYVVRTAEGEFMLVQLPSDDCEILAINPLPHFGKRNLKSATKGIRDQIVKSQALHLAGMGGQNPLVAPPHRSLRSDPYYRTLASQTRLFPLWAIVATSLGESTRTGRMKIDGHCIAAESAWAAKTRAPMVSLGCRSQRR